MIESTPPSDDLGLSDRFDTSNDAERKRLELEKLQEDLIKVRLEVGQLRKADFRAGLASLTPALLGIATIMLGLFGYFLNANINHASEEQRRFENYNKLTEAFSKGGAPKVGAVGGLEAFLRPGDDHASQTAAFLANDLGVERDATVGNAIVVALAGGGQEVFEQVLRANESARQRLADYAFRYINEELSSKYGHQRQKAAWVEFSLQELRPMSSTSNAYMSKLAYAGTSEMERRHYFRDTDSAVLDRELTDAHMENSTGEQSLSPAPQRALAEYARAVPAFILTSEVLTSLLEKENGLPHDIVAQRIAIFNVDLDDRDLSESDFFDSHVAGSANGADLSFATFNESSVRLFLSASQTHRTSLCGAKLRGATFDRGFDDAVLGGVSTMPDMTATDWWDVNGLSRTVRQRLQGSYPQREQDQLRSLPFDELKRKCAARRRDFGTFTPRPGPTPAPQKS